MISSITLQKRTSHCPLLFDCMDILRTSPYPSRIERNYSMRLDHYLALSSIGTKKKVREYIYAGAVHVNATICTIPATEIQANDTVQYLNTVITPSPVYYLLHKPQGCITARSMEEPTIYDCFSNVDTTGLFAVGRLDKDTEGLLIVTNDGVLSNSLMAPANHVPKTYLFLSLGTLNTSQVHTLESGVDIGYDSLTSPAQITLLETDLYTNLSKQIGVEKMKKIKKQPTDQQAVLGLITIVEGKKHQVKRMLRHVGCPVIYLKRISIGSIVLPDTLPVGSYCEVSFDSIASKLS